MEMRKYKIKKADLEINLAPLIDVIFLLLIFFMVASTLDDNQTRATIRLPEANLKSEIEKFSVILYLDKTGQIFLDNKMISWDEIYNYFYEQEKDNFGEGIEVYADKEVHFEYIAAVMELAGDLNIDKVNFILKSKNIY
jgi:biopolymer transport protein ExbD